MEATPEITIAKAGGVELGRYPWPLLTPKQCVDAPSGTYIVKGLIAVLFGQPGEGKSVLAPHIGYQVARGKPVFGRRTKPCRVLYLACEDGRGMERRIKAIAKIHQDTPDFWLLPAPVNLRDPEQVLLVQKVATDLKIDLIIVDTIAAAFPGIRENEDGPEGMGGVVATLRKLTRRTGSDFAEPTVAVLALHHAAKADGTTPRGHGCLMGDADITLRLKGEAGGIKRVTLGKNRNGASTDTFAFSIQVVELGKDDDNDPITAPVLVEQQADGAGATADSKQRKQALLPDAAAIVLTVLRQLGEAGSGKRVKPALGMPKVLAINRRMLIDQLLRESWFADQEIRATVPDRGNAILPIERRAQTRLGKALDALKRKGLAHYSPDWVWLL